MERDKITEEQRLRDDISRQLRAAQMEVERLIELLNLLEATPEIGRILELLQGQR